jgi:two-component system, OmpR family, KDP operon response regulator KdpE
MSDPTETILLIDDDTVLVELLSDQLRSVGYRPLAAFDGTAGLQVAAQENPDLVLLDVMMPGLSGWEVCERLRDRSSRVPIIMLSALDDEIDKLRAFRLGVDDYVTVPCSFSEVVARVGAVLRRTGREAAPAAGFRSGELSIDFDLRRVLAGERVVELTAMEYRLLETLARRSPGPVCLDTIIGEVWTRATDAGFEDVKHYVWTLRRKIEPDPGNPHHLVTVRGFGYRLQ